MPLGFSVPIEFRSSIRGKLVRGELATRRFLDALSASQNHQCSIAELLVASFVNLKCSNATWAEKERRLVRSAPHSSLLTRQQALNDLKSHRQRLAMNLRARTGYDFSLPLLQVEEEIAIIDAGTERLTKLLLEQQYA
jgi:hypothetical protein